jgi:DNA repair exonuclease SbcCD ATPase subunit
VGQVSDKRRHIQDDVQLIRVQSELQSKAKAIEELTLKYEALHGDLEHLRQENETLKQATSKHSQDLRQSVEVSTSHAAPTPACTRPCLLPPPSCGRVPSHFFPWVAARACMRVYV